MKKSGTALAFVFIVISFCASADKPTGSVYLDGRESKSGLILAHGKGKHPRWLVVDPLRKGVNARLGYHTISLQMPTGYSDWKDYADGFPDAYSTIKKAIAFLKNEKGVTHIFLMGHSMGSRMSSAFVANNLSHGLSGLIIAGCRNNGGRPLSCAQNLKGINLPVLDIWGGKNRKDSNAALQRKEMVASTYTQVEISGANHKFKGYENELLNAVVSWLKNQN